MGWMGMKLGRWGLGVALAIAASFGSGAALGRGPGTLGHPLAAARAKEQVGLPRSPKTVNQSWEQQAQALIDGYRQHHPVQWSDRPWSPVQVNQIRDHFLAALARDHGAPIGYKAALVNPAVRSRFNATEPIRGVLFSNMLRSSGLPMAVSVATRPLVEGDLLVRVGDGEALQRARTDDEVLSALDAVIPFIEVPDLIYSPESQIDASAIAAANAGARTGWVGYPVAMTLREWQALPQVQVQMTMKTGSETMTRIVSLGDGLGMEPAAVVRWLRDELRRSRLLLERGDILSLGTLLPPVPPQPGMEISLRYLGIGEGKGAIVYGRFSETTGR